MDRRAFLAAVAASAVGTAGCAASPLGDRTTTRRPNPTRDATTTGERRAADRESADGPATGPPSGDVDLPVPESALRRGTPKDAIPAVDEPAFGPDWRGVEVELGDSTYRPRLDGDDRVIGVERAGTARAYPLKMLGWHEVVNDVLDGPILVTYCPLCRSGVLATRRVGGTSTVFGVSGLLWRENLVMYDERTESLWSQLLATAIRGPETGARLDLLPSALTTWGAWREAHPDGEVLLPAPRSGTVLGDVRFNYSFDIYDRYERIWEQYPDMGPGATGGDTRLPRRMLVVGVRADGEATAYPQNRVGWEGVVNDAVGDLPVVVAVAPGETLVAYDRRVAGETLRFEPVDGKTMAGGGSRWERASGRALDGPHAGATLARANDYSPMLWFAWLSFNPETAVYRSPD